MGNTIPRQLSLGCIRKVSAHEPTVKPVRAIPPGPVSQFLLWALDQKISLGFCKLKQILFFPRCFWSECSQSNRIELEQRVGGNAQLMFHLGLSSHAWFFINSPLPSPYTHLNSKTDIPTPFVFPCLAVSSGPSFLLMLLSQESP